MLETQLKLSPTDQGRPIDADAFAEAEFEEPFRYERVKGRLVVMSSSGLAHTRMISAILERLYLYKHNSKDVIDLIAPEGWMRAADHTDRVGDIAIYLAGHEHPEQIYDMVPDLVFEVVSEGSEERDYVLKRKEYYDLGIQEYAIVDPFRKIVVVLTPNGEGYADRELQSDNTYRSPQLPGFILPLIELPW